jgi:hypothetical protein
MGGAMNRLSKILVGRLCHKRCSLLLLVST